MTLTEEQKKEKKAAYQRAWISKNPERVLAYRAKYHDKKLAYNRAYRGNRYTQVRAILWAAKDKPCADCGVKYPPCVMDFDHRDPAMKSKGVGKWASYFTLDGLYAEMAKCDIVCANCHRLRTWRHSPSSRVVAS